MAEAIKRAAATVEELRRRHHGKIVIDAVVPDYYARFPKPCVEPDAIQLHQFAIARAGPECR